jgi:hypothetical protein
MKMDQTDFEKNVMETILKGNHPVLASLRNQYVNSIIERREFTGAGFYTYFRINEGIPPLINRGNFEITDIVVKLGGNRNAIGVVLFIRDGYLKFLEGYTLASEEWPQHYLDVELEYNSPNGNRNLKELVSKLSP